MRLLRIFALLALVGCANLERSSPAADAATPELPELVPGDANPEPDAPQPDAPEPEPEPECDEVDDDAESCECDDDCEWNESCHSGKCRPRCNGVENPHG